VLADFDEVVENGAERIMAAWESETAHRRELEKGDLKLSAMDSILGKVFALIFVLSAWAFRPTPLPPARNGWAWSLAAASSAQLSGHS
jgi:uncharacterized membrane protein